MKKIVALVAMISLAAASSAFAATVTPSDTDAGKAVLGDGKALGKLSANVTLGAEYDTAGYAIVTAHGKGTKVFGTSHDSTAIYSQEGTIGAPSVSNSGAFGSGWTAM